MSARLPSPDPALSAGPPAVSAADLAEYSLRLGDDALVLSHRLAQWITRAPELEEDVALANLALDLLGQARSLLTYAGQVGAEDGMVPRTEDGMAPRTEDDLAYLRDDREFRNVLLVELPDRDFAHAIVRLLLVACYQRPLYAALAGSADPLLAGVAGKAVKEVAYHRDHAAQWTLRLGDGTPESHRRAQVALDALWPYGHELVEADALVSRLVTAGVAPDPARLEAEWAADVRAVLAEATLTVPDTTWRPTGGRRGLHTEHLGYLLAEMQHLHRAHPEAAW